jgi:hypothetical protein
MREFERRVSANTVERLLRAFDEPAPTNWCCRMGGARKGDTHRCGRSGRDDGYRAQARAPPILHSGREDSTKWLTYMPTAHPATKWARVQNGATIA